MIIRVESRTPDTLAEARHILAELADSWHHPLHDITDTTPDDNPHQHRKALDPVAITALIVSLPSAALAATDLADRITKRRRARKLIDTAKTFTSNDTTIHLIIQSGTTDLATGDPDTLLEPDPWVYTPAREIISAMMRWHDDVDGNFVEQFQTTGFDARLWELYLFAALTEANLDVEHPNPAPDFLVRGLQGTFALEATTINPSRGGSGQEPMKPPQDRQEADEFLRHYLPIKYAGPLTKKLAKEYWKSPEVADIPLVFAIQDFHSPQSMTYSGGALPIYLYGYDYEFGKDAAGNPTVTPVKIAEHRWGNKVVRSGFFSLSGAENVSAVLFNSSGTISKFNRMGVSAGFGSKSVVLIREGTAWGLDPGADGPAPFIHFVSEGYPETWTEGLDVFHNPSALRPLDVDLLPDATHHRFRPDGQMEIMGPRWRPIESTTKMTLLPES